MKIGLLLIATNKYTRFVKQFIESADKFLFSDKQIDVTYFVFTNVDNLLVDSSRKIKLVKIEHEPWPYPTLKRYDYFYENRETISNQDYLFYSDVDMKFVGNVESEILSDRVATIHPGFWNKHPLEWTYERRTECNAHIEYGKGNRYYAGGFNGGKSDVFLEMAKNISQWRKDDERRGIIPVWHDESYMNKYMYLNLPTKELSPSYCYPESWNLPFEKKLLALDKNHSEMRA